MCVTFLEIDCLKQIVMGEFQGQQRENSYTASISMLQHKIQLELSMRGFGVGFVSVISLFWAHVHTILSSIGIHNCHNSFQSFKVCNTNNTLTATQQSIDFIVIWPLLQCLGGQKNDL